MLLPTVLLSLTPGGVELPAPLTLTAPDLHTGTLELRLDLDGLAALRDHRRVTLVDFPLPGGRLVDLELEQRSWRGVLGAPVVDEQERMEIYLGLDLSVWRGAVVGDPDSEVYLGLSRHGSHGHVRTDGELFFVSGRPAPDDSGQAPDFAVRAASDQLRPGRSWSCGTTPASPPTRRLQPEILGTKAGGIKQVREAVSVDYWVSTQFESLEAEIVYIYTLLWSVSELYLSELGNMLLTFPYVEFWTHAADPWGVSDGGGTGMDVVGDALDEFEDKWGSIFEDKGVHLALLLLGKSIGGGKASGAGMAAEICPGFFAGLGEHAVCSGVVDHTLTFPPVQGENTWPFRHIAHEIGHNLGGIHTHDNGLDECDEGDPAKCPEGTIMSYCHTCNDDLGTANTKLSFHPVTKQDMWDKLADQDCLVSVNSGPIHISDTPWDGFENFYPNGTLVMPYTNFFEGMYVAGLVGGASATVRLKGGHPGSLQSTQEWPASMLDSILLSGTTIVLEGWPGGSSGTIGN